MSATSALPALCRSVTLSRPRRIVQTGRSSMNILVTVRSGTIASTLLNQSTECLLILATTDANGRPTAGSHLDGGNRGGSSAPDGSASAEKECAATLRRRWPLSATPMLGAPRGSCTGSLQRRPTSTWRPRRHPADPARLCRLVQRVPVGRRVTLGIEQAAVACPIYAQYSAQLRSLGLF